MKRLSIALLCAVAMIASPSLTETVGGRGVVEAGPRGTGKTKKTRKQKRVERLLWSAQYYLLREHDTKAAAAEYRKVLRLDRQNLVAALALADIHIRDDQAKKAVQVLRKLSRKRKNTVEVWRALGMALARVGDQDAALLAYRKAVSVAPRDASVRWLVVQDLERRYRGGDKQKRNELIEAATAYLRVMRLRKGPLVRRAERLKAELSGDTLALTIYDAKRAYDSAFEQAVPGRINRKMGLAREGFEACLAKEPHHQLCHFHLGLVYSSVKASAHYDLALARKHFRAAGKVAQAHVELARMHRRADELDKAKRSLEKALIFEPSHQLAQLELGIIHKLEGRDKKAVQQLVRAYQVDSSSSFAAQALDELSRVSPNHELVKRAMMYGGVRGNVFSTDRYTAAVGMLEQAYGGVEEDAAELSALRSILRRLEDTMDLSSSHNLKVAVLKTTMPNAMALPNGQIYFTRGMLDFIRKTWADRPVDKANDVLAHIMAHEVAHVTQRHTLQSQIFVEAVKDASRSLDRYVLTHVTRLQEIEADRVGIVAASLAGYHPRGGVELMEKLGQKQEIPHHLNHPTFEERVNYLEEYWSNEVKHAYLSFGFGVAEMRKAKQAESSELAKAAGHYEKALSHFKRFRDTLKPTKRVLSNMGVANAKLGVYALAKRGTALHRWQSAFSVEKRAALSYKRIVRGAKRGGRAMPRELSLARSLFKEALKHDPDYVKARVNLATVHVALGKYAAAEKVIAKVPSARATGPLHLVRGIIHAEQRKYASAGDEFRAATRLPLSRQAAMFNLARLYQISKYRDKATKTYRDYLKIYPRGPWSEAARKALKSL